MGTRADFYVGRGETAEWIGSIAWDGYPSGIETDVFNATTEAAYRERIATFFSGRRDVTRPADGWPWPWEDSRTTDYAYAFDGGKVWASWCGHAWFDPREPEPEDDSEGEREKVAVFPRFSKERMAPPGSNRTGFANRERLERHRAD